jgi:hypothetical protein
MRESFQTPTSRFPLSRKPTPPNIFFSSTFSRRASQEGDLAVEDVEAFLLPAMDMRWRPAARRYDGFPEGVLAVRVFAGRQEAVHVADDGDGATFGGLADDGSGSAAHRFLLHEGGPVLLDKDPGEVHGLRPVDQRIGPVFQLVRTLLVGDRDVPEERHRIAVHFADELRRSKR